MATRRPREAASRSSFAEGGALSCILPVIALAALTTLCLPRDARAQTWTASADVGRSTFDVGVREIETSSLVLGAQYTRPRLWMGANLSPELGENPLWGGLWAAVSPERRRGPIVWGVDAAAQVYGQDDPLGLAGGIGAGASAVPRGSYYPTPALELGIGGGGQVYYSGFGAEGTEFTRSVGLAEAFGTYRARDRAAEVGGVVRHLFAEEAAYTLVEATVRQTLGKGVVWGSLGTWISDFIDTTPWEVGGAIRVLERTWLRGNVRQEAFDPVYLSDARTSWSAGISLAIGGGGPRAEVAEVPLALAQAGAAELRLPNTAADGPIKVAGDFTGWEALPMGLEGREWVFRAPLRPGVYHYAYVDGHGEWFVPEGTPGRKSDGMGGFVAVLIVEE